MTRKPEPMSWGVYRGAAAKLVWLGTIEAPDERTALEKAAKEYGVPYYKLIAVRR
jgi:hypothetical protein